MPPRWFDIPNGDWVTLNAKLRGLVAAIQAQGTHTDPLLLGGHYLWVDGTGRLRIKSTPPTSATDGTVVGTQT